MKRLFPLYIFILLMLSCQRAPVGESISELYGSWINPQYQDSLTTYTNSDSLETSAYGFTFSENNCFYERKNSGWCGTPPISYANYEGTWSILDSMITIDVPYWGGTAHYQWLLISVNEDELRLIEVDE